MEECEELCSQNKNCVAFEYGVAYGGGGNYQPRDCQLSDSAAETEGCDGSYHNLDLYVRGNKQRFRHLSSHNVSTLLNRNFYNEYSSFQVGIR